MLFSGISKKFLLAKVDVSTPLGSYDGHDFPSGNLCSFISEAKTSLYCLFKILC